MRRWLDQIIPSGSWHGWLVDISDGSLKILIAVVVFLVLRRLALRGLQSILLPLLTRASGEDLTAVSRVKTLEGLARSSTTYVLLFLVLVTLLQSFNIQVTTLLAGAGVAGLALSFGAQRLVRDVLTGFFLLLEDQFRVGEVVSLMGIPGMAQANGTVLEMGLRTTRMLDLSGKLITVSNGDIGAVINHSRGPVTATVDVGIPADAQLTEVREALAGLSLPQELFAGPAALEGVTALEATRVVVRIAAPAQAGRAPEAEMVLRQSAGEALRQRGIEIR